MVKITNQIFNYNTTPTSSTESKSVQKGSIWNNPKVQKAGSGAGKTPAEITKTIINAIKNKDINTLVQECENMDSVELDKVAALYKKQTGQSFVSAIKDNPAFNKVSAKIEQNLRSKSAKNSYSYNEFLAYDLIKELNGNDTAKINILLKEGISKTNIRDICAKYQMLAIQKGETAATDEEKKLIGKFFQNPKRLKANGLRNETLFQGILNNKALTLSQKREYLQFLTNNIVEYAQKNNIPAEKISLFKKRTDMYIKDCTATNVPSVNNADRIEKIYIELLSN